MKEPKSLFVSLEVSEDTFDFCLNDSYKNKTKEKKEKKTAALGTITAGVSEWEKVGCEREKRNIDGGIRTVCVYMLWEGLGKQSHHGGGGVKLGNAEQHPGFILYFILDCLIQGRHRSVVVSTVASL